MELGCKYLVLRHKVPKSDYLRLLCIRI
uniref:Uncharacterized protein n=1 Tax=Rhizophora mucronata TaxID=61149 RepID=A0A2P2N6N3_RHIMU